MKRIYEHSNAKNRISLIENRIFFILYNILFTMYKIGNRSTLQKKIYFFDKCDLLKLKIFNLLTGYCHTLLQLPENAYIIR